ncbi:MAG: hypothetical protein HRT99_03000 [Mycoplasmatales bacterium]|nr:hypothetical protein [Mycoplasmatales bacterium]
MVIKISNIINKNKIMKESKGNDIFIAMKAESLKNPIDMKFQLDFDGILQVSPFVFRRIVILMQKQLKGDYTLEIVNGSPLIVQSFKLGLS